MKAIRILAMLLAIMLCMSGTAALAGEDQPYAGTTITVYNWYDYIDPAAIDMFTAETGIKVQYVNFTNNEEMYTKLSAGAGEYDVIVPSDYIIERMIKNGELAELDLSAMPNVAGLQEWLKSPAYDPEGKFSVPYMWGTVGLLVNTDLITDEITSWSQIFDAKYQNSVMMMNSIRDTIGVTLKMLGHSLNTNNEDALWEACDALVKQKEDGIVVGYLLDEVKDKMILGEAGMALMYSGDAAYAIENAEGDNLKYVVPTEGSNVWVDGMCIPANSSNKEAAQVFIDYMCRPDIAFMNQQYIYYCSPIAEVENMLTEEERALEYLNPPQDVIDRCEFFNDISDYADLYEEVWMEIRMAG